MQHPASQSKIMHQLVQETIIDLNTPPEFNSLGARLPFDQVAYIPDTHGNTLLLVYWMVILGLLYLTTKEYKLLASQLNHEEFTTETALKRQELFASMLTNFQLFKGEAPSWGVDVTTKHRDESVLIRELKNTLEELYFKYKFRMEALLFIPGLTADIENKDFDKVKSNLDRLLQNIRDNYPSGAYRGYLCSKLGKIIQLVAPAKEQAQAIKQRQKEIETEMLDFEKKLYAQYLKEVTAKMYQAYYAEEAPALVESPTVSDEERKGGQFGQARDRAGAVNVSEITSSDSSSDESDTTEKVAELRKDSGDDSFSSSDEKSGAESTLVILSPKEYLREHSSANGGLTFGEVLAQKRSSIDAEELQVDNLIKEFCDLANNDRMDLPKEFALDASNLEKKIISRVDAVSTLYTDPAAAENLPRSKPNSKEGGASVDELHGFDVSDANIAKQRQVGRLAQLRVLFTSLAEKLEQQFVQFKQHISDNPDIAATNKHDDPVEVIRMREICLEMEAVVKRDMDIRKDNASSVDFAVYRDRVNAQTDNINSILKKGLALALKKRREIDLPEHATIIFGGDQDADRGERDTATTQLRSMARELGHHLPECLSNHKCYVAQFDRFFAEALQYEQDALQRSIKGEVDLNGLQSRVIDLIMQNLHDKLGSKLGDVIATEDSLPFFIDAITKGIFEEKTVRIGDRVIKSTAKVMSAFSLETLYDILFMYEQGHEVNTQLEADFVNAIKGVLRQKHSLPKAGLSINQYNSFLSVYSEFMGDREVPIGEDGKFTKKFRTWFKEYRAKVKKDTQYDALFVTDGETIFTHAPMVMVTNLNKSSEASEAKGDASSVTVNINRNLTDALPSRQGSFTSEQKNALGGMCAALKTILLPKAREIVAAYEKQNRSVDTVRNLRITAKRIDARLSGLQKSIKDSQKILRSGVGRNKKPLKPWQRQAFEGAILEIETRIEYLKDQANEMRNQANYLEGELVEKAKQCIAAIAECPEYFSEDVTTTEILGWMSRFNAAYVFFRENNLFDTRPLPNREIQSLGVGIVSLYANATNFQPTSFESQEIDAKGLEENEIDPGAYFSKHPWAVYKKPLLALTSSRACEPSTDNLREERNNGITVTYPNGDVLYLQEQVIISIIPNTVFGHVLDAPYATSTDSPGGMAFRQPKKPEALSDGQRRSVYLQDNTESKDAGVDDPIYLPLATSAEPGATSFRKRYGISYLPLLPHVFNLSIDELQKIGAGNDYLATALLYHLLKLSSQEQMQIQKATEDALKEKSEPIAEHISLESAQRNGASEMRVATASQLEMVEVITGDALGSVTSTIQEATTDFTEDMYGAVREFESDYKKLSSNSHDLADAQIQYEELVTRANHKLYAALHRYFTSVIEHMQELKSNALNSAQRETSSSLAQPLEFVAIYKKVIALAALQRNKLRAHMDGMLTRARQIVLTSSALARDVRLELPGREVAQVAPLFVSGDARSVLLLLDPKIAELYRPELFPAYESSQEYRNITSSLNIAELNFMRRIINTLAAYNINNSNKALQPEYPIAADWQIALSFFAISIPLVIRFLLEVRETIAAIRNGFSYFLTVMTAVINPATYAAVVFVPLLVFSSLIDAQKRFQKGQDQRCTQLVKFSRGFAPYGIPGIISSPYVRIFRRSAAFVFLLQMLGYDNDEVGSVLTNITSNITSESKYYPYYYAHVGDPHDKYNYLFQVAVALGLLITGFEIYFAHKFGIHYDAALTYPPGAVYSERERVARASLKDRRQEDGWRIYIEHVDPTIQVLVGVYALVDELVTDMVDITSKYIIIMSIASALVVEILRLATFKEWFLSCVDIAPAAREFMQRFSIMLSNLASLFILFYFSCKFYNDISYLCTGLTPRDTDVLSALSIGLWVFASCVTFIDFIASITSLNSTLAANENSRVKQVVTDTEQYAKKGNHDLWSDLRAAIEKNNKREPSKSGRAADASGYKVVTLGSGDLEDAFVPGDMVIDDESSSQQEYGDDFHNNSKRGTYDAPSVCETKTGKAGDSNLWSSQNGTAFLPDQMKTGKK
jgi:hypothetical protein